MLTSARISRGLIYPLDDDIHDIRHFDIVDMLPIMHKEIKQQTLTDKKLRPVLENHCSGANTDAEFNLLNGMVVRSDRLVIPNHYNKLF